LGKFVKIIEEVIFKIIIQLYY